MKCRQMQYSISVYEVGLCTIYWAQGKHRSMFDSVMRQSMFAILEPRHEISNNVVCATSKASDQPAHMRRLIRAFASRLNIHDC